ncbi:MAG TPA: LCP family protein [Intrasporangium sp.]|uniref:LCP family protein n=1 Tax=Intrasporangium sp. TaxID=1925024 RepID=UPI002D799E6E|nr:LCP family protein [Intrasporangium sp.]HET7399413.1 LCP family protein [Intrasporangium sp.]
MSLPERRRPAIPLPAVVSILVALLVAATGCTGTSPSTGPAPSGGGLPGTASSSSASSAQGGQGTVAGAPAGLAALVADLYAGRPLTATASPAAAAALAARRPAAVPAGARATTGSWRGEQVAAVSAGDDVTLAVGPAWRVVGGWWPSLGVGTPSLGTGPRWVLAIGSDARPGEDQTRTRADTLQVVGTDGSGGGGVMGMARDLWVPLSTGGAGKINSALVFGGPRAQLQTVRGVTGLPIEGYVLLGFASFTRVVDELGGIPVVIPKPVTVGPDRTLLAAGAHTLTGAQALAYARERKSLPDGDFGRSRHQGELLVAAAVKARLAGPLGLPGALTTLGRHAASDLSAEQILTYAARFHTLDPLKVGRGVAQGAFGWAGQQSIVVLGPQARALFGDFRDGNLR